MKKIKQHLLLTISLVATLAAVSLTTLSWAGFDLDNGVGLKGQQMGGAYTAIASGVDAIYWNPSNLWVPMNSATYVSYTKKFDEVSEYSGLWNVPLGDEMGLGFGYYHIGVDGIAQMSSSVDVLGRTFAYETNVALVSLGWKLGDITAMGITARGVQQKAVSMNNYVAADVGLAIDFSRELKLGLVATDIIHNHPNRNELKPGYRVGLGLSMLSWVLAADYDYKGLLEKGFMHYGATWKLLPIAHLKAGYSDYDKQWGVGLTILLPGLELDYQYTNPDLGAVHQVGLQVGF